MPWVPGVVVVQIALIQDPSSDVPPTLWAVRITRSRYTSARTFFLGAAVVVLAGCGSAAGTSSATSTGSPGSVVAAGSIAFPVAVGDTWVYQVVTSVNHQHALDTKRVADVTPVPEGHRATMSDSAGSGTAASTMQHYLFYGNGQIGWGETHLITTSELVSFTRQAPGS